MDHESHHNEHGSVISAGFGYGGGFDVPPGDELIGLQARMEMLGIPPRHLQNPDAWRGLLPATKPDGSSSGAGFGETTTDNENFMFTPEAPIGNPWQQPNRMMMDGSSLQCLFPMEGSEQPPTTQALSLSLRNPDSAVSGGAMQQSFHHPPLSPNSRNELFSKPSNMQQDARFFPSPTSPGLYQQPHKLKSSQYLVPAQELLSEFCSLDGGSSGCSKHGKSNMANKWEEGGSSSWNQSLQSLDLLELQKRKSRLLCMLEEVDRRYRKYCEQMRAVVSGFEAVAGEGAATVYSTLASRAMSKHFRCLRDGITAQIMATRKAMGEKDPVGASGSTRGETPRLRMLDQCLRQQKAQQGGMMENQPWRPQRGLPERSVSVLRAWLFEHFLHPYPSDVDKHILARQTGLSRSQVSNWFINARVRLWKPMVEEMYTEETKDLDNQSSSHASIGHDDDDNIRSAGRPNFQLQPNLNPNPSASQLLQAEDQKPVPEQLLLNDSESLASIINSRHRINPQRAHPQIDDQQQQFGLVDMDFSSYNDHCGNQNFGSGVSLTLGLPQHTGGGMGLSFSPASRGSLFFSRDGMDDHCQPVQFPVLDGDHAQNQLPYRDLMGAQLLHDLAG